MQTASEGTPSLCRRGGAVLLVRRMLSGGRYSGSVPLGGLGTGEGL